MEELFIIKNGQRLRLDIGAGGLTIEVQNPLTVSLEDIALTRSWSFSLPGTQVNRAAFGFAGVTPRAIRDGALDKYAAEYYADGVPLLREAVLYLDSVKDGDYQCQLVDSSQAGLARIKEENKSLRDLVGDEKIKVSKQGTPGAYFDNTSLSNSIIYNPGVSCVVDRRPNEIRYRVAPREGLEGSGWLIVPPPVVPVRWLLRRILAEYGLTLGIGEDKTAAPWNTAIRPTDDVFTWGVVPLVTTEITADEGRRRSYCVRKNVRYSGEFFGSRDPHYNEEVWSAQATNFAVDIDITLPGTDEDGGKTIDIYHNGDKVASVQASYMVSRGTATGWRYLERVDLSGVGSFFNPTDERFELRVNGRSIDVSLGAWADSSSVVFFQYVENGIGGQTVRLASTLPDVGAWDFIKYLCVQNGGVPYVEDGVLKIRRYEDMGAEVLDFTQYFNGGTQEITRAVQGLAQKNYYLMATESLDDPDKQYSQRIVCIEADDTTLEPMKETYKAPFASEYISQDGGPVFTGRTIRAYIERGGGVVEAQESEPFVGLVCRMPAFELERYGNDTGLYTSNWWLKCAAIDPDDIWVDRLTEITKSAGVYKVRLKMSAVDVAKFDPLKPVYIAPLSLLGLISSIRYTAGKEYAEITIIKEYNNGRR